MNRHIARFACLMAPLLLAACAASSLPGYQNAYRAYSVPETLVQQIKVKFASHGLTQASVGRDNTGRIQLIGTYQDEDQVDTAFLIVQSVVGIKSTSPFYPEHVLKKRWEAEAGKALTAFKRAQAEKAAMPVKLALVVGINRFADHHHLKDIQGEDDAVVVKDYLQRAGYRVTALLGEQATKANVEAAIAKLDSQIRPNDDVFIYVSSHGNMPVPAPGDKRKMSILTYDSGDAWTAQSEDATEVMLHYQQHSVPDTLIQKLAQKPSRTMRVLIDTCYSGDMLDDIQDDNVAYVRRVNGNRSEVEGISLASWSGPTYTSKAIQFSDDGAPSARGTQQSRTVIDRSRAGYNIITATSPNERSLGPPGGKFENPVAHDQLLKGSYFTQALFAYLEQNRGQLAPAFRDAKRFTSDIAPKISQGKETQNPREWSTIPEARNDLLQ